MTDRDELYVKTVPHERQILHQYTEFYAFFHFTVNTFTGKEWGDGTESPEIFHPTRMDAYQWIKAIKKAGMKGAILTCKHHDGFCLWPSKYTEHSVASSPWRKGKGDIVKEVSSACREYGLKFGVYLSPWDRNHASYGKGREYDDYYVHQLEELLTGYGEIFCVWLDGACGEGKKQTHDWERYYRCIRKLQPNACISICGPDVRWCGNEAGDTRRSEWSVVPERLSMAERVQEASQQMDDENFRFRRISSSQQDLGSREALKREDNLIWYPSEVNTSIRPGWFYHRKEDDEVRSLEELIDIYYRSVGGNSTFLLNIPPMPEGLLPKADVKRLQEFGDFLEDAFRNNLVEKAVLQADSSETDCPIEAVKKDDYQTWYQPRQAQAEIRIALEAVKKIRHIVLKENIRFSQRIERFEVCIGTDDKMEKVYEGTVVGYKKIIPLKHISGNIIWIRILDARICPTLSFVGVYQ